MHPLEEVYDRSIILENLGGNEALFRHVCEMFLAQYPNDIHQLGEAVAAQDLKRINRLAHTMKGMVSNFAASTAVASAHALEKATRTEWNSEITELVLRVDAEFEMLSLALRKEVE